MERMPKTSILTKIKNQRFLLILLLPAMISVLIFNYIPMAGIVIAFQDFNIPDGIIGSKFVGFKFFINFINSYHFKTIMRNTLGISILKTIFCFPAPIIFALLLNEIRKMYFKRVVQTISYLPFFISWVIVLGIWTRILSPSGGIVNTVLTNLGIISEPINFMYISKYMWPFAVVTQLWKDIGFNSILYLAALSGINPELYEACVIDGGGRWKQTLHITIPGIKSTVSVLFILSMGGLFGSNFDQLYLIGTAPVLDVTEVIDTYIYRIGLQSIQFSLGTAVGLMRSVLSLLMVIITNYTVKLMGEKGIW